MLDWLLQNKEWVFSGIGVGIITLILKWLFSRRPVARFPKLRVHLAFGFLDFGPELSEQMLLFTVANPGKRPIQIAGIKVALKKGSLFFLGLSGESQLPCIIDPGTNVRFWVQLTEVERALKADGYHGQVTIHAVVSDALGHEHQSNSVNVGA